MRISADHVIKTSIARYIMICMCRSTCEDLYQSDLRVSKGEVTYSSGSALLGSLLGLKTRIL